MLNINFVPDDYVQNTESRRTNILYVVLLLLVLGGLGGAFATIRIRQNACIAEEELVAAKMARVQESIEKFEKLQVSRKAMMKTALTTYELLDPVPKSILLADMTNNLPAGVSLSKVDVIQKAPKNARRTPIPATPPKGKAKDLQPVVQPSPEKLLETKIDIQGIAPSDLEVAAYIQRLGKSTLLQDVALVESMEHEVNETCFRQFKLKAMLKKEIHLSKEDIEQIRSKAKTTIWSF